MRGACVTIKLIGSVLARACLVGENVALPLQLVPVAKKKTNVTQHVDDNLWYV